MSRYQDVDYDDGFYDYDEDEYDEDDYDYVTPPKVPIPVHAPMRVRWSSANKATAHKNDSKEANRYKTTARPTSKGQSRAHKRTRLIIPR